MKALKNITTISLLFGLLVASEVFASAGKIIYSHGDNYARDGEGKQRRLSKNAEIFSGDTLFTSAQGRMQVRFSDGGMVSVYPRSEYKIERFIYTAENEDEQRGFFSLLKGAARQITGLLGKNRRDNFKFSTTVATIGIRGTGFFVQLCRGDCYDAEGNLQPDGMYVKNDTGLISMTNEQGEIMLAQGQSAFAASSHDAPQQIHQPLAAYNVAVNDVETYDFDIGDSVPPIKPIIVGKVESVYVFSVGEVIVGSHVADTAFGDTITQSDSDNIAAYQGTGSDYGLDPAKFDSTGGSLVESGQDQSLGVVWNRWTGGYTLTENGIDVPYTGDIHLIGAAQLTATLPTAGTVSYQSSAGTAPTFIGPGGNLTGTQNVAFDVNYLDGSITNLSVTASFAGGDITATSIASPTSGDFIAAGSTTVLLAGVCPLALCSNAVGGDTLMDGSISINLVGANAEGAFGSYGLSDWTSTTVTGSYLATQTATVPLIPQ